MKSSLKFCVIASGEFDFYAAEPRACEWDIAAGHAILKNAGGIITDFDGNEINYGKIDFKNPKNGFGILGIFKNFRIRSCWVLCKLLLVAYTPDQTVCNVLTFCGAKIFLLNQLRWLTNSNPERIES